MGSKHSIYSSPSVFIAVWLLIFNACSEVEVHHPDSLREIIEESNGNTIIRESGKTDTVSIILDKIPNCYSYISYWMSDPGQATALLDINDTVELEWDPVSPYYIDKWDLPRNIIIEAVDDSLAEGDIVVYLHLDGGSFCSGLNGSSQVKVIILDDD